MATCTGYGSGAQLQGQAHRAMCIDTQGKGTVHMATCIGSDAQGHVHRVRSGAHGNMHRARCTRSGGQGQVQRAICRGPWAHGNVHKVRCTGPDHKVGCTGPWALGLGAHVMVSCTRSPEGDQTVISKYTFQNSPHVNSFSSQSIHKHENNIQTNGLSSKSNCSLIK